MFLIDSGEVIACGMNMYGALGIDTQGAAVLLPGQVVQISEHGCITHISCGGAHTLIVTKSGDLLATGSNSCGQLGLGPDNGDSSQFKRVHEPFDSCPVSYVSCGEEFSIVITSDRRVFSCGLGLGGQLGLGGNDSSCSSFKCITALNELGIEELTCCQGAVFAVTGSGDVYSWGTQMFGSDGSNNNISSPAKCGIFAKRKRARRICGGRKHYLLLTISPYGPNCRIISAARSADLSVPMAAGTAVRLTVKSYDVMSLPVDFGGMILFPSINKINDEVRIIEDLRCSFKPSVRPMPAVVDIDDNMDGTYAVTCRVFEAGRHTLSLLLDELHIEGSPFDIEIIAGCVDASASLIVKAVASSSQDNASLGSSISIRRSLTEEKEQDEAGGDILLLGAVSGYLELALRLFDKHGNPSFDCGSKLLVVEYTPQDNCDGAVEQQQLDTASLNTGKHTESSEEADTASSNYELLIRVNTPRKPGKYTIRAYLASASGDKLYFGGGRTIHLTLKSRAIDPKYCRLVLPETYSVGIPLEMRLILFDDNNKPVIIEEGDEMAAIQSLKSLLNPLEPDISARAIIHMYKYGSDSRNAIRAVNRLAVERNEILMTVIPMVSGKSLLTVWIGSSVIENTTVYINPGDISPKFSEILNPRVSLSAWKDDETSRVLILCGRDDFGNRRLSGAGDVTAFILVREGPAILSKTALCVNDSNDGSYTLEVPRLYSGNKNCEHFIEVYVRGAEIMYSPFHLSDGVEGAVDDVVEPKQMGTDKKTALIDITRRRAIERLRKEQLRLKAEKEENARRSNVKRTGGGFIIQYSRDI